MGAHLNAYSTREHTAYYIKALSKDLPKGDTFRKEGAGPRFPGVPGPSGLCSRQGSQGV